MNAEPEAIGHSPLTGAEASELVRAFWDFVTREYGTRAIAKANAVEMKLAAQALGLMGVLDAEAFLRDYTTTIGRRIYVPFEPGREDGGWSLWGQLAVCVHEHQHVEQLDRDGWLKFAGKYLLSSAGRAAYEAEAYRCDMELHFWRTGEVLDPRSLAAKLKHYACASTDIEVAEKALTMSAATVRRGGVVNRASQKAVAWLNVHAPAFKERA
jgi:hypothetical protein